MKLATRCRVIVDNDYAGDPDGLVALAHHLLAPGNRVVAITSSFLSPVFGPNEGGCDRGADLARELAVRLGTARGLPVHAGVDAPFEGVPRKSGAAEAIIAAARADDPLPLVLVCGGPLTNVADALALAPDIADRLSLCWVGGAISQGAAEYNRDTDPAAMRFVFDSDTLEITQFPVETYRRCATSAAELETGLLDSGPVGEWLWERFEALPIPEHVAVDPVWPLGDSVPLLVTALNAHSSAYYTTSSAPPRVVFTDVDARLLVADLWALLRRHARSGRQQ